VPLWICIYHSEIVKIVVKNLEETLPCPLAGFEPAIPTIERPQNYSLDRPANGISHCIYLQIKNYMLNVSAVSYVLFFLIHVCLMSSFNKITVYHIPHNAIIQSHASCSPDLLLTWLLSSCPVCIKVTRSERHRSCHNAIPPFAARYNSYDGDAITTCYSPRYNPEQ
jgi:hypothetical protein